MQRFLRGLEKFTDSNRELDLQKILGDIAYTLEQAAIVSITDSRGTIRYANEHFEKLSQYSLDDLIGANQRIVNSGYHDSSFFKEMWATIGSGKTWRGDIRNRKKDGSFYWVDTTIVPFLNDKGKPYQYVSIRYDITARKLMEEEIRKSAELYEIITTNASDFIAVIDREGKFKYVSPSFGKLLGHSLDSLYADSLFSLIYNKDRQKVERKVSQFRGYGRQTISLEYSLLDVKGGTHMMEAKLNEVHGSVDYEDQLLIVMRDVT